MAQPTCVKNVLTKDVKVCWDAPDTNEYQYTLMWTAEEDESKARYNRVNVYSNAVAGKTCYDYRTDSSSTQYNFKVLA